MANNCDEDIIVDLETTDIKTIIAVAIKENGRNIWKECLKIESHSCCINMQQMERNAYEIREEFFQLNQTKGLTRDVHDD